jgi:hypothetical protein
MQNTPNPDLGTVNSRPAANAFLRTALLAAAMFLIPVLLGLLFVLAYQRLAPAAAQPSSDSASVTNRPAGAAAADLAQLIVLRRDLRNEGLPLDDVNLRIWAAHAAEPERLFNVPPPEEGKHWNWHVSQDGRCAIAVSVQLDTLDRRAVGLYDLVSEKWLWEKALPWPDTHEAPYVFDRHTVLRFTKNARRFAMELNPDGQIVNLSPLGTTPFAVSRPIPSDPAFPGEPVALKNGVFFAADARHQSLIGYAQERLPGLRYAGKGDSHTLFSGNGLLKFTLSDGRVVVSDSLTQTVLQRTDAWPKATNTVVTGALTTHDGSQLSVFLRTEFGGTPPASREWSVALSLYSGTVMQSFNADALLAKPRHALQRQALSPDKQWQVEVSLSNELTFAWQPDPRSPARVNLKQLLGLQKPLDHIAFLEEGRHLVLRQGDNFWLLDFDVARGYADLLARKAANAENPAAPRDPAPLEDETPSSLDEDDVPFRPPSTFMEEPNPSIPSALALRAEWFAHNQSWHYAAALLEEARNLQQFDSRAPRVNPLLLARCQLLSGQRQKARLVCREALLQLASDRTDYNRMIRYQLQGLLFANP